MVISDSGCFARQQGKTTPSIVSESTINADAESGDVPTTKNVETVATELPTTVPGEVTTESVATTPVICPPGVFGNVPDTERCDKFYLCAGGTSIPLFCASGYEFDPLQRVSNPVSIE